MNTKGLYPVSGRMLTECQDDWQDAIPLPGAEPCPRCRAAVTAAYDASGDTYVACTQDPEHRLKTADVSSMAELVDLWNSIVSMHARRDGTHILPKPEHRPAFGYWNLKKRKPSNGIFITLTGETRDECITLYKIWNEAYRREDWQTCLWAEETSNDIRKKRQEKHAAESPAC